MYRTYFVRILLLILSLSLFSRCVQASGELMADDRSATLAKDGSAVYPFPEGTASGSERAIEHTFLLRNTSAIPLTIYRIQTPCGCTKAELTSDDKKRSSGFFTLLP